MVFYDPEQTMGNETTVETHKLWYSDQTGRHYTTQARAEQAERQSAEAIERIYADLKIYWDYGAISIVSMGYYRRMEDHFDWHRSDCGILSWYVATGWGYCPVSEYRNEGMDDIANKAISIARGIGGYAFRNDNGDIDRQYVLDDFWNTTD